MKTQHCPWFMRCNFRPLLWRGFSGSVLQGASEVPPGSSMNPCCLLPLFRLFPLLYPQLQCLCIFRLLSACSSRHTGYWGSNIRPGSGQPGSRAGTLANSAFAFQNSLLTVLIFTAVGCCSPVCLNALHFLSSLVLFPTITSPYPAGCQRSREPVPGWPSRESCLILSHGWGREISLLGSWEMRAQLQGTTDHRAASPLASWGREQLGGTRPRGL